MSDHVVPSDFCSVPPGWKLVPVKLTPRMIEAAWDAMPLAIEGSEDDGEATDDGYAKLYEAMIAYAPEAPTNVGGFTDTLRLDRFAQIALAVEGKAEGFGSQLCADRELGFVREDFLSRHAQGDDAGVAFRYAMDQLLAGYPPTARGDDSENEIARGQRERFWK